MEELRVEVVQDHLLAFPAGRGVALVDTGSPVSVGRAGALELLGVRVKARGDPHGVLATASRHLGRPIDWLLGNDVLGAGRVLIDWPGRRLVLGAGAVEGDAIPIDLGLPVPRIDLEVAGRRVRAFLDTGAYVSYAEPAALAGREPERWVTDFSPWAGEFRTPLCSLPVRVGRRDLVVPFGVLPDGLAALARDTRGWVLGSDFFRERRILLDYAGGVVVDAT